MVKHSASQLQTAVFVAICGKSDLCVEACGWAGLAAVANLSGLALKYSIAFDHFQGANGEDQDILSWVVVSHRQMVGVL